MLAPETWVTSRLGAAHLGTPLLLMAVGGPIHRGLPIDTRQAFVPIGPWTLCPTSEVIVQRIHAHEIDSYLLPVQKRLYAAVSIGPGQYTESH